MVTCMYPDYTLIQDSSICPSHFLVKYRAKFPIHFPSAVRQWDMPKNLYQEGCKYYDVSYTRFCRTTKRLMKLPWIQVMCPVYQTTTGVILKDLCEAKQ